MQKLSFETRETRDGLTYTEITAQLSVKEHTEIQLRVNLPRLDGSVPLAELQAQLLDTAILELQRERERYPATAGSKDQPPS